MHRVLLHEYLIEREAPLRERAARDAAQLAIARRRDQRPFGFPARLALGRLLVAIGRRLQGRATAPESATAAG